jgi:two-component system cell cycle response regulator
MSPRRLLVVQECSAAPSQPIWADVAQRGYDVTRLKLDETASAVRRGLRPDAVVLDMVAAEMQGVAGRYQTAASRLMHMPDRRLPVLAIGPTGGSGLPVGVAEIALGPGSGLRLVSRVAALRRLAAMQGELARRTEVAAAFGVSLPDAGATVMEADGDILVVGAGRRFLAVEGLLATQAVVTGAMSPRIGLDYLERRSFDTILTDLPAEEAAQFVRDLRQHPNHAEIPVVALGVDAAAAATLLEAGATDVVDDTALPADLRRLVSGLIVEHRFRRALRAAYARGRHLETHDNLTGLYGRGFAMAHLAATAAEAATGGLFGLAGFVLDDLASINARHGYAAGDRVIRQVGLILARLARAEDLVARHGGRFVAVLRDAGAEEARRFAERCAAVIGTTDLLLPESGRVRVTLIPRAAQVGDGDPERQITALFG